MPYDTGGTNQNNAQGYAQGLTSPIYASPRDDAALTALIYSKYPQFAALLAIPDLKRTILDAAANNWGPDQLTAAVQGTSWWKTHNDKAREFDMLRMTDPASANRMVAEVGASVNMLARSMGITGDVSGIAAMAARNGWSSDQIRQMLGHSITMETIRHAGMAQAAFQAAKNLAGDYYIRVDDGQALDFAKRVVSGEMSVDDVKGWAQQQAKAKFGYLSDTIDKGITVREYFGPMQAEMARLLDKTPEQIDLMNDPRYSAVTRIHDPSTGVERAMTVSEAQDYVRHLDEWRTTDNAKSQGAGAVVALGKIMGQL